MGAILIPLNALMGYTCAALAPPRISSSPLVSRVVVGGATQSNGEISLPQPHDVRAKRAVRMAAIGAALAPLMQGLVDVVLVVVLAPQKLQYTFYLYFFFE